MQDLLKAAYETRDKLWVNASKIRKNCEDTYRTKDIKHLLAVLCDRGLLKFKAERGSYDSLYTKPGQKKPEKIHYERELYRITDKGIKYVESGFKAETKNNFIKGINIENSPNSQVMYGSHGSVQINEVNPEIGIILTELRNMITTVQDQSKQVELLEMTDFLEEECYKEKPKTGMVKKTLEALKSYGPTFTTIAGEIAKMIDK